MRVSFRKKGIATGVPVFVLQICLLAGVISTVNAAEVPPGFHLMPNGDIMANNPAKVEVPAGYYLAEGGILKKTGSSAIGAEADNNDGAVSQDDTNISDTTLSDASEVDATAVGENSSDPNVSDTNAGDSTAEATPSGTASDAFDTIKSVTVEDFGSIPDGYHRMPDGTLMANNPSKADAPEGYHLMPDGTLMRDGQSVDHSRHSHAGAGMLMAEYVFQRMYMDGFLDTTSDVSHQQVVDPAGIYGYGMSSTDMSMDMHMVMLMYHTRSYMLMLMGHYMVNSMGMYVSDGTNEEYSTMETRGLGDTKVTIEVPMVGLDWTVGLSIPTGSTDERGDMVHSPGSQPTDTKYPYGMQLGSGTYDLIMGLGYEGAMGNLKWGVGYEYTLRTGENDNGYTLGDKSIFDAWAKYHLSSTLTQNVGLKFLEMGQIEGSDPELVQTMSPAADASNSGGRRLDLGLALRYENAQMTSVGIEFDLPIYQNLYGPQMKTDWILGINAGFMF